MLRVRDGVLGYMDDVFYMYLSKRIGMESSVQEIFDRGELTKSPVYGWNLSYKYLIRLTAREKMIAMR